MLNKQGELVRPNYKWLRRLGLRDDDAAYVTNLKRQRNQKKAKKTPRKQRPQVTATVHDANTYDRGTPVTTKPQHTIFTSQVRNMETKYKDELELANSILTAKLDGTRYDIANNQEVKEALKELLAGQADVLHYLRTVKQLRWMTPLHFLQHLIVMVDQNRTAWYAAKWINKQHKDNE